MVLIHAGFLAYEMGASRSKNALASGIKNILAFAMIVPFFYFVGWWVYCVITSYSIHYTKLYDRRADRPDR